MFHPSLGLVNKMLQLESSVSFKSIKLCCDFISTSSENSEREHFWVLTLVGKQFFLHGRRERIPTGKRVGFVFISQFYSKHQSD